MLVDFQRNFFLGIAQNQEVLRYYTLERRDSNGLKIFPVSILSFKKNIELFVMPALNSGFALVLIV